MVDAYPATPHDGLNFELNIMPAQQQQFSSVLMAFIPTRFKVELSHVGACMTATLSSSHTSSLVLADARIGWPVAPSDFACRDFPPCRQPAVRFLTL